MDLIDFLKEFVVSTLFCLDLKDPENIRNIQDNISVVEISKGRFSTDGAKLLAAKLGCDEKELASKLLVLFEIEDFVKKASADDQGNVVLDLVLPKGV